MRLFRALLARRPEVLPEAEEIAGRPWPPWTSDPLRRTSRAMFQSFAWYHPDQEGSASLEAVMPALTGRGYDGLAIADGETAGLGFLEIAFGKVEEKVRE